MDTDKSHNIQGELAGWRPRRAAGVASSLKPGSLKTKEEPVFPFESEDRKKAASPFKGWQEERILAYLGKSAFLCQLMNEACLPHSPVGGAICLIHSTRSNVNFIPNTLTHTPRITFD